MADSLDMFSPRVVRAAALVAALAATFAGGGRLGAEESGVVIDIHNVRRTLYPLAIPLGARSHRRTAREVAEIAGFDLTVSGWFDILDNRSFLADLEREHLSIEPEAWKSVGAFGVIKYQATRRRQDIELTFKLYEVQKGAVAVLERVFSGKRDDVRRMVHQWCDEVVRYYTGEPGFFTSKIAFVTKQRRGGKRILAMDFDGANVYSITRDRGINILPAWSPTGTQLAFTSFLHKNPDLYTVGAAGGDPVLLASYRGMNTGAAWSPDGREIALTLTKDGNPEIYVVSATTGQILRRLTDDRAIDASPAWSPDGRELAFISDREGGPQVFVMNAQGGAAQRVSFNGPYNTTPTWSPRKGERVIAYTTRDEGNFDIVTLDLNTGEMVRITQNQGDNEEPSFSPNGRAIAFASTRREARGVYIASADGTGKQVRVWKGWATSVDWGPAR